MEILEAAPSARLITTFLGMGILTLEHEIDPHRVFLLNPGQSFDLGDRQLTAFRPPVYDSPATTGFYDQSTGTCFTSDCFGSPMATPELTTVDDIRDVPYDDLIAGQRLWATVDSPWGHRSGPTGVPGVARALAAARPTGRALYPPAPGARRISGSLDTLAGAPDADPFTGPDQAALQAMLAEMEPAPG
jgi:hypothetical protein